MRVRVSVCRVVLFTRVAFIMKPLFCWLLLAAILVDKGEYGAELPEAPRDAFRKLHVELPVGDGEDVGLENRTAALPCASASV